MKHKRLYLIAAGLLMAAPAAWCDDGDTVGKVVDQVEVPMITTTEMRVVEPDPAVVRDWKMRKRRRTMPRDSLLRRVGDGEMYSPSTLIISYDTTVGKDSLLAAVERYQAELIYNYRIINAIAIRIPEGTSIQDAITYFQAVPGVIAVNRDRIMHLHNDTNATMQ